MTRFWQRRIAVLLMTSGALTAALYGLSFVAPKNFPLVHVGLYSGVAGAIALLAGIYTFVHTPPEDIDENARFGYLVFIGLIATLIYSTGGLSSLFLTLWGGLAVTAAFFGAWGVVPVSLISIGAPLTAAFTGQTDLVQAIYIAAIGIAAMIAGFFIKPAGNPASADTNEDKSYHALARQLSQVAGKSDVVIKAIGEGVVALDGKGVVELINPAAQQIVGWGKEDAVGLNYKSILKFINSKGDEVDSAHDPVAHTFSTNATTTDNSLQLLTQSDKKLLISVVVSPVGQPGNGAIVVFRDITKEKSEERQQAEFISTASHEMRTPVAEIEGYLGLVLNPQTAQIDDKAREFVTKAHTAVQHLGRLFQDLLDVSKAEDGRMQNNPKVVEVVKFMESVTESLQPKAQAKGLSLIFKPAVNNGRRDHGTGRTITPAFYVNVDNDHLREVADNLVENAVKYTLKGQVTVDVTGDDQHVRIAINDSGIGIPKEDIPHLFQKFYRVDNSETREIGGTGLGLYLCRRLIEAMNGRLWVESVYKQGSTFYVELPRTSGVDAGRMIQLAETKAVGSGTTESTPPQPVMPPDELIATLDSTSPQPAAPPAASQLPVPAMPAPQPQTAPTPQSPQVPHPLTEFPNTPLTTIEQDPSRYIAQIEGRPLSVPPRQQP